MGRTKLTWEQLVSMEPLLADLEADCCEAKNGYHDWYMGGLKKRMTKLVGWYRSVDFAGLHAPPDENGLIRADGIDLEELERRKGVAEEADEAAGIADLRTADAYDVAYEHLSDMVEGAERAYAGRD